MIFYLEFDRLCCLQGLALQVGEDVGRVLGRVDLGIDFGYPALGTDEVGHAERAQEFSSPKFLGCPGTVLCDHDVIGIGQEREGEIVFGGKFLVTPDRVFAHAEHGDAQLGQLMEGIAEVAGLFCAPWRIVFGVKVEDDPAAAVVG